MKLRMPRHDLVNCCDIFTIKPGLFLSCICSWAATLNAFL